MCGVFGLKFYIPIGSAGKSESNAQLAKKSFHHSEGKWEFKEALNHILPHFHILEIGSGARAPGCRRRRDPERCKIASESGYETIGTSLQSKRFGGEWGLFDVVYALRVLEPVAFAGGLIRRCLTLLKPGVIRVLSATSDAVMTGLDPLGLDLLIQPPHHLSKWDKKVFSALRSPYPLHPNAVELEPLSPIHAIGYPN